MQSDPPVERPPRGAVIKERSSRVAEHWPVVEAVAVHGSVSQILESSSFSKLGLQECDGM